MLATRTAQPGFFKKNARRRCRCTASSSSRKPPSLDSLQRCVTVLEPLLAHPELDAQLELKRALRSLGSAVDNDDRGLISRVVLGSVVLRARLEHLATTSRLSTLLPQSLSFVCLYLLYHCDDTPQWKLSVSEPLTVQLISAYENNAAVLTALKRASPDAVAWPEDPELWLSTCRSLPLWLAQRLVSQYGAASASALAAAWNSPGPVTLRVNTLRASVAAVQQSLSAAGFAVQPCVHAPCALRLLDGRPPLGVWSLPGWADGFFEVQDEGSQLIAWATSAAPGETVLDLCAGNGGKTLALASRVKPGGGRVICFDVNARRLTHLAANAARAGCEDCITLCTDEAALSAAVAATPVDCVLVDAPCSSSGALRRTPHARWKPEWEEETKQMPATQRQLLAHAASMVRPGGRLVYATCSVLAAENQDVSDWFRQELGEDFTPLPFDGDDTSWPGPHGLESARHSVALLPHVHDTDGFYIARWLKRMP
jgi:16S rRNA (cytosine967-C5)-methyltransferase